MGEVPIRLAVGDNFFINARTDLFLKNKPETHDVAMVDEAIDLLRQQCRRMRL